MVLQLLPPYTGFSQLPGMPLGWSGQGAYYFHQYMSVSGNGRLGFFSSLTSPIRSQFDFAECNRDRKIGRSFCFCQPIAQRGQRDSILTGESSAGKPSAPQNFHLKPQIQLKISQILIIRQGWRFEVYISHIGS